VAAAPVVASRRVRRGQSLACGPRGRAPGPDASFPFLPPEHAAPKRQATGGRSAVAPPAGHHL